MTAPSSVPFIRSFTMLATREAVGVYALAVFASRYARLPAKRRRGALSAIAAIASHRPPSPTRPISPPPSAPRATSPPRQFLQ